LLKKNVLPGDFLSTEEEFEPGKNAFAENGEVRSDSIGKAAEDTRQKTVSVEKHMDILPARINDTVVGEVVLVKESSANLDILPEPDEHKRKVLLHSSASLPIRFVSRDYVKNIHDMFKIGDLVKAKIASVKPFGIDLKTNEPELGVIRAFCSRCRQPLHLFGAQLKCLACGSTEQRKLSREYSLK
jgi:exosome complex component CSL4